MIDKQTFASSAIWKITEAISTKGIALVISIVLARLLLPADYGIVALTAVFISLSTIIVQSGLSTALIRKDKIDEIDYNNGFYLGFGIAIICYLVFYITAPFIARFYGEPLLTPVMRVQMLSLFLVAFGNIQTVIVTREFRFKELCVANVIANLVGGTTGVILAYKGFGVWALVFYTLLRDGISNFVLFLRIKWHPSKNVALSRLHSLVGFSIWVLIATVVDFVANNYSSTLMGKKYSLSELGLYSKGNQIPEMICLQTFGAISSVLLPTLSAYQNDKVVLKRVCKKLVEVTCYIICPMMIGLAMIADKLVPFLFTEKWNACIPVFILACIYYGVNPFRSINMQLIYALGDSKKGVLIETLRMIMLISGVSLCAFVLKTSIYGISAVAAAVAVINVLITQFAIKGDIGYGILEWFRDMMPTFLMSIGMAVAVGCVGKLPIGSYAVVMFLQIVTGIIVYVALSAVTKNSSFMEVKGLLIQKFGNRIKEARTNEED